MVRKEYSAGAVKMSFWFAEFRRAVGLLAEGKDMDEIRRLALTENLFAAPTPLRSRQIFSTVSGRIRMLDESFIPLFMQGSLSTQKLLALIAALAYDTLFFDFVYEVIRDKLILGTSELADRDLRVFLRDKQQQSERAAKWTDPTLARLGKSYKTMLYEAGVLEKGKPDWKIVRPILDPALEAWLREHELEACVRALMGVK